MEKAIQHAPTGRLSWNRSFPSSSIYIPIELLDNSNPIRHVRAHLQSSYRLSVHLSNTVHGGTCGACGFALAEIPLQRPDVFRMPCCKCTVHRCCWTDERTCPSCCTGLLPMPCVVCWEDIECWGGDTREVYEFSKAHRFVCCGADTHLICKMQFLSESRPKCRACDCYLNPNRTLHSDFCGAADYIFARRERRKNQIRRRMGRDYTFDPPLPRNSVHFCSCLCWYQTKQVNLVTVSFVHLSCFCSVLLTLPNPNPNPKMVWERD